MFKRSGSLALVVFLAAVLCGRSAPAWAQAAKPGRLLVTVVDPNGGLVPGVTVTVVGLEDATKRATIVPGKTNDKGLVTFENVALGRYSIQAEFPGFEPGLLRNITVRAGDNKHVVALVIQGVSESVSVAVDATSASERSASSFGQTITQEEIAALSDDPNEMQQQLMDLVGPDAILRIDSFEGQQLPPKSQIKSIHVTRDQFAAETEQPGSTYVDVITQPGVGPLSGGMGFNHRQGQLDGRDAFVNAKGPAADRNFNGNIGGTLAKERSNFSVSLNGENTFTTPITNQTGTGAQLLGIRQPDRWISGSGLLDYALTKDQTLRFGYNQYRETLDNQGVGVFDAPSRAFSSRYVGGGFRAQEAGPIGRRAFINTRLSINFNSNTSHSAVEAPTVVILDGSSQGGAQQAGGTRNRNFTLASDVDYIHGINSWRAGVQISGGWSRSDRNSNYLGTYTFSDEAAFLAGAPLQYTQQVGNPLVSYFNVQGAVYLQDDLRLRKNLTISPGIRYSLQNHVHDHTAAAPRFGITWSPGKSGHTTLRASVGLFSSWLPTGALEQSIRFDGHHQNQLIIVNPSYPNPGADVGTLPTNKYLIGDFNLQRNLRYSAGMDHTFSPRVRMNVLYNYIHLIQQPRGENLNAPVNGVRPDPAFANVIETVTDAEIRRHEIYVNFNLSLVAPGKGPTFDWKRLGMTVAYSMIRARNNSDGTFAVPPSGTPATEWGPGPADRPYRVNVSLISTQLRNLNVNLGWSAQSGSPYTLTTGFDDNLDGFTNDRPPGVGLRSLRGASQSTINLRVNYTLVTVGQSGVPAGTPGAPRSYRVSFNVNASNLTNHVNYGGYSGVMTSSFFMQPVYMANPRNVYTGLNLNF